MSDEIDMLRKWAAERFTLDHLYVGEGRIEAIESDDGLACELLFGESEDPLLSGAELVRGVVRGSAARPGLKPKADKTIRSTRQRMAHEVVNGVRQHQFRLDGRRMGYRRPIPLLVLEERPQPAARPVGAGWDALREALAGHAEAP